MTKTTTTCDHCGKSLKSEIHSFMGGPIMGGPANSLRTTALQVAIAIPPQDRRTYRDFCNEHCLRDFLLQHLPSGPITV